MLENDNGCDRCRDYDKVREELENTKRKSTEDQKNALKKCEDSKNQLQKKLLTVGAVAIIGGTILGKDLVDKIAEYIESFNKVKNAATGLVGMATPPIDMNNSPVENENKNKDEPEEKSEPKEKSSSPYAGEYVMDSIINTPFSHIDLGFMDPVSTIASLPIEMLIDDQKPDFEMNLSGMLMDFTLFGDNEFALYMPKIEETPSFLEVPPRVAIPSPSTMSVMILPVLVRGRRRRK